MPCQLTGPRRNDIPIAMITLSTQILVSNTILQQEEKGSWEMIDFRTRAGNIQDETGVFCSARSTQSIK